MLELSTWVIVLAIAALLIILSAIALWVAFRQDRGVSSDGSFAGERSCEVSGFEALDCHCRPQLKLFQNSSSRLTLVEIAGERGMTLAELVAAIDAKRQHANISSAIRLFVLGVYRDQRR